jgi:hypothetical protein
MRTSGPPELANWLIAKLVPGEKRESMIGDLIEQHHRGRSSAWYWRQTIGAIATSFAAEVWQHKLLAVSVTVLSACLGDVYMLSRVWVLVWRVDRLWYPHLIDSRWSWLAINPWAYRLQPYWWTSNLAWCAMLAALTWTVSRLRPRQRSLVIALFLIPQVSVRLPYVWGGLTAWLREPSNPILFYGVLWFSVQTFVMIPCSIVFGGRGGRQLLSLSQSTR